MFVATAVFTIFMSIVGVLLIGVHMHEKDKRYFRMLLINKNIKDAIARKLIVPRKYHALPSKEMRFAMNEDFKVEATDNVFKSIDFSQGGFKQFNAPRGTIDSINNSTDTPKLLDPSNVHTRGSLNRDDREDHFSMQP